MNVFLDDLRPCPRGFVYVQNRDECVELLRSEPIGILSLDYDLGWGQPTGYEVALYIAQSGRYPDEIYLHTSSREGLEQMYKVLSHSLPPASCSLAAPCRMRYWRGLRRDFPGRNKQHSHF